MLRKKYDLTFNILQLHNGRGLQNTKAFCVKFVFIMEFSIDLVLNLKALTDDILWCKKTRHAKFLPTYKKFVFNNHS